MKNYFSILLLTVVSMQTFSQETGWRSIHEMQSSNPPTIDGQISHDRSAIHSSPANGLTKIIFGYHPYWVSNSAMDHYRFDLLSHVAYFSYEVDPATGGYKTIHDWLTTPLIAKAKAAGTKVHLCVTNFGSSANTTLLTNPVARDTLIANLIRLVKTRNADGVNIDFEALGGSQRANLVSFFRDLHQRMKTELPASTISVAAPAVDWNNAWDIASLKNYIDVFFVMCYDYYWSGSDYAGPVAPIKGTNYNVTRTIDWYISQGASPLQIVMGVPYYGYDWQVESDAKQAKTTSTGTARTYATAKQKAATHGRKWDATFLNPWYQYQNTNWYQCWYDDSASLAAKYDLVLQRNIGGVGMWALGYDDPHPELWDLLRTKFFKLTSVQHENPLADGISLSQNYPNPFSETTSILLPLLLGAYHYPHLE